MLQPQGPAHLGSSLGGSDAESGARPVQRVGTDPRKSEVVRTSRFNAEDAECVRPSLVKEESADETLKRIPAGPSRPAMPSQQPEASLAWGGEIRSAKRRQRVRERSIEPRKLLFDRVALFP